jgi:hypothetical protein
MFKARFFNAAGKIIVSFEVESMAAARAWAATYNRDPHVVLGRCELIGDAPALAISTRVSAMY